MRGFDVFKFRGLKDRKVAPLRPGDIAPRSSDDGSMMAFAPLAVLLPVLFVVGLVRRRTRRS